MSVTVTVTVTPKTVPLLVVREFRTNPSPLGKTVPKYRVPPLPLYNTTDHPVRLPDDAISMNSPASFALFAS